MTQPRMIVPGTTYLITRRTVRRHHLFRPDHAIRRVFLYCLFTCAKRFDIEVHVAVLMSTHEHLVVTDPEGKLPIFLSHFHRLVALCTKVLRKWDGAVWDHRSASVVRLLSQQAIVEKMAYAIANPAEAHLVRFASEWPGVTTRPAQLNGRTHKVARPDQFFDNKNATWPKTALVSFTLPQVLKDVYGERAAISAIRQEVKRIEQRAAKQRVENGTAVVGAERILAGSPYRRTKSFERRRARNPTFAVGRGQGRLFSWAVKQLREFRQAYRRAYEYWRTGADAPIFPMGTFWMPYAHGADVVT